MMTWQDDIITKVAQQDQPTISAIFLAYLFNRAKAKIIAQN
jgi:hypothetical protein